MTYASREKSDFGGEPVELYEFIQGSNVRRLSASLMPGVNGIETTYGGNIYEASALTRTGPETSSEYKKTPITLEIPASDALVGFFRIYVPANTYWLTIYRGHRDAATGFIDPAETIGFWRGRIRDVRFRGAQAEIICDPLDAAMDRTCLRYQYQNGCNHALYGTQCGIDRELFRMPAVVTAVSGSTITVSAGGFNTSPTNGVNWFTIGEIVMNNGDRRMILSEADGASATEKIITVGMPIENLAVADVVQLYAGCDRSISVCRLKFDNRARFGGFSKIPGTNIFQYGLPPAVAF